MHVIRTETDNERALEIVEALMHCPERSPEENELYDLLIVLIEKFEQESHQPGTDSNPHSVSVYFNFLISRTITKKALQPFTSKGID